MQARTASRSWTWRTCPAHHAGSEVNFLAHCVLAQPGAGFIAGGVLGDFVKGPIPESLPRDLRAGIRLHRRIDSYSNRVPEMKVSVARFDPALRRAAPVLLDILADHCLTLTWSWYADQDLAAFTARVYEAIEAYRDRIPARGRDFVSRMVETDLLARYDDPQVIERAMAHVLARLRVDHLRDRLQPVLESDLPAFIDDFRVYFPLLRAFAAAERARVLEQVRT